MLYRPEAKYVTDGFCNIEVVPLPKSHFQLVGLSVDRSVNLTRRGAQPLTGVAEKSATGCPNTFST
jgi:hypothetical protein